MTAPFWLAGMVRISQRAGAGFATRRAEGGGVSARRAGRETAGKRGRCSGEDAHIPIRRHGEIWSVIRDASWSTLLSDRIDRRRRLMR
jgi:hypothetical protein